jgi:23S rRNA (cytosine1962-C5)-methyltransferase
MANLRLKPGREKAIRNRHPWVFSGAVAGIDGQAADGEVVVVRSDEGAYLGRGTLNRRSQIVVRILTWEPGQEIDEAFWAERIAAAAARRRTLEADPATTAYRLIYAESDLVPGLIVDRYGDYLVAQFLTLGIAQRREAICEVLAHVAAPAGIYERSDVEVRAQEGLAPETGVRWGSAPPPQLEIQEAGHRFSVDLRGGQKTGFYLDQRPNRAALAPYARGQEILDAFSYSGAFGVYAAAAGAASIRSLDSSEEALDLAQRNMALNGFSRARDAYEQADVFQALRTYRDRAWNFDLIVLDPPKFAPTRRHVSRASRAYKDINLLALKLLRPGGILFTFSCSGGIDADLFQKIVFGAAVDAGREVQVIERLFQGSDHPVLLSFPESAYLKGLVCRVL